MESHVQSLHLCGRWQQYKFKNPHKDLLNEADGSDAMMTKMEIAQKYE